MDHAGLYGFRRFTWHIHLEHDGLHAELPLAGARESSTPVEGWTRKLSQRQQVSEIMVVISALYSTGLLPISRRAAVTSAGRETLDVDSEAPTRYRPAGGLGA